MSTKRDTAAVRYRAALTRLDEIDQLAAHTMFGTTRLGLHREYVLSDLERASAAYVAALPLTAVSRCPFTGETATLAIDTAGLDGPWWNYSVPRRPLPEGLPPSMIGFDGALRLQEDPPVLPYLVGAGPQVPTVIPRVLETDGVVAVVSSLPIGGNPAWFIGYYADPELADPPVLDDWGTDHFLGRDPDGAPVRLTVGTEARDAHLKAWVERGRLRWIAPGDASLSIREGVAECPYLGLEGSPEPAWLVRGQLVSEISQGAHA